MSGGLHAPLLLKSYLRFRIFCNSGNRELVKKIYVFSASTVFREPSVNTTNIGLVWLEEDGLTYE
jgi:hypothetical protein